MHLRTLQIQWSVTQTGLYLIASSPSYTTCPHHRSLCWPARVLFPLHVFPVRFPVKVQSQWQKVQLYLYMVGVLLWRTLVISNQPVIRMSTILWQVCRSWVFCRDAEHRPILEVEERRWEDRRGETEEVSRGIVFLSLCLTSSLLLSPPHFLPLSVVQLCRRH